MSLQGTNAPPAQKYPPSGNHVKATKPPQAPKQQSFVDPAILSFSKPPNQVNDPAESTYNANETQPEKPTVAAALTEPFSNLGIHTHSRGTTAQGVSYENELEGSVPLVDQSMEHSSTAPKPTGKKTHRGGRAKIQKDTFQGLSPVNEHDGASNTNPKTKGWRQTAFVEPSNPMELQSPESHRGKTAKLNTRRRKKQKQSSSAEPNGWATEDATDIQELGEFDFQSNLSKFDKRRVFEEIRNDDTTADEDRLASFNRKVPKPGTQGGKNLHWSENVLDSPQNSEVWYSDADASDENGDFPSRDLSRASTRARSSRKGSAITAQSSLASQVHAMSRNQLSQPTKPSAVTHDDEASTGRNQDEAEEFSQLKECLKRMQSRSDEIQGLLGPLRVGLAKAVDQVAHYKLENAEQRQQIESLRRLDVENKAKIWKLKAEAAQSNGRVAESEADAANKQYIASLEEKLATTQQFINRLGGDV